MIEYKGYVGSFEFDEERHLFYGKVSNIDDLVTFQGKSVKEVKESFLDAVKEYISWCKKYRAKPEEYCARIKEKENSGGG